MRIYVLLAHPDNDSLNGAFANAYEETARDIGHDVRRQNVGEMNFDPVLWKGYKQIPELEPDLKQAQANISWCQHWAIFLSDLVGFCPGHFQRIH